MENADPDALRLDDLDSNASLDEDAVPMRKVTANNKVSPASLHGGRLRTRRQAQIQVQSC